MCNPSYDSDIHDVHDNAAAALPTRIASCMWSQTHNDDDAGSSRGNAGRNLHVLRTTTPLTRDYGDEAYSTKVSRNPGAHQVPDNDNDSKGGEWYTTNVAHNFRTLPTTMKTVWQREGVTRADCRAALMTMGWQVASPPMRGATTPRWGYVSCTPVRSRPLQEHMGGVLVNAGCNSHVPE
ncbi:hypothetical protein EDB86DRAFT_2833223 [Lactarius hatsudake]|nr:hypothetical protein EDB86DRAFT_2833223 [Lactarius hatsudake]